MAFVPDEETVDGDPLTARDALAAGDGFEDAVCPLAVLRCGVDDAGQEVLVQGLLVKEVEGRLVLAIPASAWHKKVNRRTLPKGFMTKVGAAEVLACAASSRSVPEDDAVLRVWFGLVEPSYEAAIEFSDEAPSVAFGALENGEAALPFVPALVAAVSDHYTFASAESGQPAVHKDALSARLDRLERLLGAAIPSGSQAGRAGAKAKAKVSAKAAARAAVPAPSVDPAVLLAARAAGVPDGTLSQFQRLLGSSAVGRMQPEPFATARADPLQESEDEAEEGALPQEVAEGGVGALRPPAGDFAPQGSQAEAFAAAMFRMMESYSRSQAAKTSPLERALEGAAGSADPSGMPSTRRNAAARRALREALAVSPADVAATVERLMIEDLTSSAPGAGLEQQTSARAWVEHKSRIGGYPTAMHMAWGAAGALDALKAGLVDQARARLFLMILQLDQMSCDKGSWVLAADLSLELAPPAHVFRQRDQSSGASQVPRSEVGRNLPDPPAGTDGLQREAPQAQQGPAGRCSERRPDIGPASRRGASKQCRSTAAQAEEPDLKTCMSQPGVCEPGLRANGPTRVPGDRAPDFNLPGLLNSLPRLMLSKGGPFSRFLRSMLDEGQQLASTPFVWPLPLPNPEVFRAPKGRNSWQLKLLNLCVAALSWLHLGKPVRAPTEIRVGAKLNRRQAETVQRLRAAIFGDVLPLRFSAPDLGRHAAKVESHFETLGALGRAASSLASAYGGYLGPPAASQPHDAVAAPALGVLPGPPATNAKPIQASRIKLPEPPRFDPKPYLDPATAAQFEDPLAYARAPELGESPPAVRILARLEEKLLLYRALADSDRLVIAPHPPGRERFGAGLFCVPKSAEKDRLIFDSRPANQLEAWPSRWTKTLASAAAVCGIVLRQDETLLMSGSDLKDCFYQFRAPAGRVRRNVLADTLTPEQVGFVFRLSKEAVRDLGPYTTVAFSSLAMGDSSACEFAQCAHLGVVSQGSALFPGELLVHACAPPRGLLSVGLVIDDLVFLERVLSSDVGRIRSGELKSLGHARLDAALSAYDAAPLAVSPDKVFHDCDRASFWGITVHGRSGWVRPNPDRLWALVLVTSRIVQLGLCTAQLLESVVGSWLSIFLLRRRLLAAMDHVFAAARGLAPNAIIRLSPELSAELCSFVLLGPLAAVCLRAPVDPHVTATDASSTWQAAVRAPIPEPAASEGVRQCIQKGAWTRLLAEPAAWLREKGLLALELELPDSEVYSAPPLYIGLARYPSYSECWRREYRTRVHINIGELEAYLREERRAGARRPSCRHLFGLDSQVCLGALCKGRSASPALNGLLSRSIAPYIGYQMLPHHIFFPSAENPADDPTRFQQVRAPTTPAAGWWQSLCLGDPSPLQHETQRAGFALDGSSFEQSQIYELAGKGFELFRSKGSLDRDLYYKPWRQRRLSGIPAGGPRLVAPRKKGGRCDALPAHVTSSLEAWPARLFVYTGPSLQFSAPGGLVLYSGRGGFARALAGHGCPWVLTINPGRSAGEDLRDPLLRQRLFELVKCGAFRVVLASPPVGSFSPAARPAARTRAHPQGLPSLQLRLREKVSTENSLASWILALTCAAGASGASWWVDHPDSSLMWALPGFEAFASSADSSVVRVDLCRFGCAWRKRTRLATNSLCAGARLLCAKKGHLRLWGYSKAHGLPWTLVAQHPPRGLCQLIALASCSQAGWCEDRCLDLAACAKLPNCCRIGEAAHPGPRRPSARPFLPGGLSAAPLHSAASARLGHSAWLGFLSWVRAFVSEDPLPSFVSCPLLLAMALRAYGDYLYQANGSLQNFRYTVVAAQRLSWNMRGQLGPAWEMVSRWERLQPVEHRTPVPEVVIKALVSLAWCLGMRRWAAVTLIAFYGLARIGEVLKVDRRSLLLPDDHLGGFYVAFVKLTESKTAGRGRPRVQHLRIDYEVSVSLIQLATSGLASDDKLYPFGPAAYRSRWDKLMDVLGLHGNALLPGGLRGGGAVWAYHRGLPISDIQWRMRLKSQSTLEHYLQEVSALNSLLEAGPDSRARLQQVASVFVHLVHSS